MIDGDDGQKTTENQDRQCARHGRLRAQVGRAEECPPAALSGPFSCACEFPLLDQNGQSRILARDCLPANDANRAYKEEEGPHSTVLQITKRRRVRGRVSGCNVRLLTAMSERDGGRTALAHTHPWTSPCYLWDLAAS